ncbi:MAG: hypothetical protein ACPG7F_21635 [Aggregatilineales bacterium]
MKKHEKDKNNQDCNEGCTDDKWSFSSIMFLGGVFITIFSVIGIFSEANIAVCMSMLPVILLLGFITGKVGKKSPGISRAIGIATLLCLLFVMIAGPGLGLVSNRERTISEFVETIDDAEQYSLELAAGIDEIYITALNDTPNLIEARISHYGDLTYVADGSRVKNIQIEQESDNGIFDFSFDFLNGDGEDGRWAIMLNPDLPLALMLNGGIGYLNLDLAEIMLTELDVNLGVGGFEMHLPDADTGSYTVNIDGGVGGGTLRLPEGAAVRLLADIGVGGIDASAPLMRVDSNEDFVNVDGVWETTNYTTATQTITIEYDGGVGGIEILFE